MPVDALPLIAMPMMPRAAMSIMMIIMPCHTPLIARYAALLLPCPPPAADGYRHIRHAFLPSRLIIQIASQDAIHMVFDASLRLRC